MIIPVITTTLLSTGIQLIDATPEDAVADSTNYSSALPNTNYTRAELNSVAIQVIVGNCYKDVIVKTQDVSDIYTVTLAELGMTTFTDAVYNVIAVLLFDEASGTATVTENNTLVTLSVSGDKALLLENRVILIQNTLYDINVDAITAANQIELSTPAIQSGTYSFMHGYRQNDELLYLEGIKSCVTKKIAKIGCSCSKQHDVEELYMNYKSIIANFDLGNFGKATDLISFANTTCSDPKVKNCACSC